MTSFVKMAQNARAMIEKEKEKEADAFMVGLEQREAESKAQYRADEAKREAQYRADEAKREKHTDAFLAGLEKREAQRLADEAKREAQYRADEAKREAQYRADETKRDAQRLADEAKREKALEQFRAESRSDMNQHIKATERDGRLTRLVLGFIGVLIAAVGLLPEATRFVSQIALAL